MSDAFTLRALCAGLPIDAAASYGLDDRPIREVQEDSRVVGAGDLFVAVPGHKADGGAFVGDALGRGAVAVVRGAADAQPDEAARARAAGAAWVVVGDARGALAQLAARRFATPDLRLAAVTGTNGKTTTTHIVAAMLRAAGRRPGVVGTVAYHFEDFVEEAPNTTPGSLRLHRTFAAMRARGATDVVLEATSHALVQRRLDGCSFAAAGLTNLTQDHLDYHGTMDAYFAAKALLFEQRLAPQGVGAVFVDDEAGRRMRDRVAGRVLTLSTSPEVSAEVRVRRAKLEATGTALELDTPLGALVLRSALVGPFNVQNLVLATGIALALGVGLDAIAAGAAALAGVPGRLEAVPNARGVLCVVDYAHTPDALERALDAVRPLARGRVLLVFGCGGDRDRGKRPLMGAIGARSADGVFVTSDNPRTERPEDIVSMILAGVRSAGAAETDAAAIREGARGVAVIVDRRAAIAAAVAAARPGDVLLIAGKGHEDYQIVGATKLPFDDRKEAQAAFAQLAGAAS